MNRSIDCLVSQNSSIERAIVSSVIDVLLPFGLICMFSLFWLIVTISHKKGKVYFLKRFFLSLIAVFYINYISLTKTLISILTCVEVYDELSLMSNKTTAYWTADSTIKCYEGSHFILAVGVGWPFLVIFTLGFPLSIACLIAKQVEEEYREGWIYNVAGFLYRGYKKRFVVWEAVIVLRKAVLAIVVMLSYPLGAKLQSVLAVFVLAIALYFQSIYRPYREEFSSMNDLEGISILVSLLTFVSSMFFDGDRVPDVVKILISAGMCFCNALLLFLFVAIFLYFGATYLRCVLDVEGVPYNTNRGTLHILKVYIVDCFFLAAKEKFFRFVRQSSAAPTSEHEP